MNILIVEDNLPEQEIMREAFREAGVDHELCMVNDGIEALDFLSEKGEFQKHHRPHLIILDLNMPRKNGLEVLSDLKINPKWKHVPVLIFSNSEFSGDVCKCYAMGASAYICKPGDFQGFVDFAQVINTFWFKLVRTCNH